VAERKTCLGLCKTIILTCKVQSSKTERETDHLHKHNMQTSEGQCPEIKIGMKIQCSITKTKYLKGEVECPRVVTEMERLNGNMKLQLLQDDICFNKDSLKIFHQNV